MNISRISAYSPNFGTVRKSAIKSAITECEDFMDLSRLKILVDSQKNNSLYDITYAVPSGGYHRMYYTIVPKNGVFLNKDSAYYDLVNRKTNKFTSLKDACKKAAFLEELDIPFNIEYADFENMVTEMLAEAEED